MKEMSRRDFLKFTGAAAVGASVLPLGAKSLFASKDLNKWRQFDGETVRILTENTPPSLGIQGAAEGFTKLTGMKAEFTLAHRA